MENLDSRKLIRLSKSCIGQAEKNAVLEVLDKEYLGMGSTVQDFEKALTDYFGRPAVCVVNGTAALQLAIQACKISYGDEVLVPSLTYVASFQAISALGAKPIACDVLCNNLNIDVQDAERRLSENTKAIMPVHYSGDPSGLDKIYDFANKYKLRVIEDAAHAFGSTFQQKKIGSFGDVACFSFDGIKNITSGEGGCIVTDDSQVLNAIRDLRLLGVENDSEKRFEGSRSWEFNVTSQGWRYHMSNVMAAIGIEQLKKIQKFKLKRQVLAKEYDKYLCNSKLISLFRRNYDEILPHIYVIKLENIRERSKLISELKNVGIQAGYHYQPNHKLDFYNFKSPASYLPVTEELFPKLLSLPLHPDLEIDEVRYISNSLIKLLGELN